MLDSQILTLEKIALSEMPGTLNKRAQERARIARRAIELQQLGVTSIKDISARLGTPYGQLRRCLLDYRKAQRENLIA